MKIERFDFSYSSFNIAAYLSKTAVDNIYKENSDMDISKIRWAIIDWCDENGIECDIIDFYCCDENWGYPVLFDNEEDAMAFKLGWG